LEIRQSFRSADRFIIRACPRCGKGTRQQTRGRITCLNCGHDEYTEDDGLYSLDDLPAPRNLPPTRRSPTRKG
jgi:uncharacterized protein (DUF983 family)